MSNKPPMKFSLPEKESGFHKSSKLDDVYFLFTLIVNFSQKQWPHIMEIQKRDSPSLTTWRNLYPGLKELQIHQEIH